MTLWLSDPDVDIHVGDALQVLRGLPDGSVDCCVTSPPYLGLRDYGVDGQLGLEPTIGQYVEKMVAIFGEVRRVLADHGTVFLNLGDSYVSAPKGPNGDDKSSLSPAGVRHQRAQTVDRKRVNGEGTNVRPPSVEGLKQKDLMGVPWRVAFALQADGWWLRSDIVWAKPNPMPESVTDRPTKAHEMVFLLAKRPSYWFDQEAVREGVTGNAHGRGDGVNPKARVNEPGRGVKQNASFSGAVNGLVTSRNVRSVWEIATQPYPDAHFATFPEELPRRCILAGCPEWVCVSCGAPRTRLVNVSPMEIDRSDRTHSKGQTRSSGTVTKPRESETVGWSDCGHGQYRPGTVLDPFLGSGTTAHVARKHGRRCVGIELNPAYAQLAARRLQQLSLLADGAA